MKKHIVNLASGYYILSCLHRKGIEAKIIEVNKKSIDILVPDKRGDKTIDVKGLSGKTTFRMGNIIKAEKHFIVFISYLDNINNLSSNPEIYIVPSLEIDRIFETQKNQDAIYLTTLRKFVNQYKDKWALLK
jgi:hypothetical protein